MPAGEITIDTIKIEIQGKELKTINSITITQSIAQHHSFEIRCYHQVFEDDKSERINKAQDLVGEDVNIVLKPASKKGESKFKGIITEVGMINGEGLNNEIILKGHSKCILLESGPKLKVYLQKTVSDIVKEVCNACGIRPIMGTCNNTAAINYVAQFNESDYQFIRRLAAIHGDWFYYDGVDLHYGEPGNISEVQLAHGVDLLNLSISMGATPLKFSTSAYNDGLEEGKADIFLVDAKDAAGLDSYGSKMQTKSNSMYASKFNFSPRHISHSTKTGLENVTKAYKGAIASTLVNINCTSIVMGLSLITKATIKSFDGSSYGSFLITALTHHFDGMGGYTNTFAGIPSGLKNVPNPYFQKPNADFELAVVTDNVDPKKHGRVRVKYHWMTDSQTWWIPTTQLYGGPAGFKNRGTVFIPEIGDTVIVGFERGDCDKPYVSQSIMNEKAILTADRDNPKNLKKIISTRNNKIAFHDKGDGNDAVGTAYMVYYGGSASVATLNLYHDGSEAHVELGADDVVHIATTAGEVSLTMKKDGSIELKGKNLKIEMTEDIEIKGKDIKIEASGKFNIKANQDVMIEAMGKATMKAQSGIDVTATGALKLAGMNAELSANVTAKVSGAMAEVSGSGMTTIKGGVVMIN